MASTKESLPGVSKVRKDFQVREDGAIAHQLQEQEFEDHFEANVKLRRTAKVDSTVAEKIQAEEKERFEQEERERRQQLLEREKEDERHADALKAKIKEEEDIQLAMKMQDEMLAKKLLQKEVEQEAIKKRQDEKLAKQLYEEEMKREAMRREQEERDQQLARDSISKEQVELARQRQRQLELSESEARRLEGGQGVQMNRQGSTRSSAPNARPQGPGGNQQGCSPPGTLSGSQQPRPPGATNSQPRPLGPSTNQTTPPGSVNATRIDTSGGGPKPQAPQGEISQLGPRGGQSTQGMPEGEIKRFKQMQLQGGGASKQGGGSIIATDPTNRGSRQQQSASGRGSQMSPRGGPGEEDMDEQTLQEKRDADFALMLQDCEGPLPINDPRDEEFARALQEKDSQLALMEKQRRQKEDELFAKQLHEQEMKAYKKHQEPAPPQLLKQMSDGSAQFPSPQGARSHGHTSSSPPPPYDPTQSAPPGLQSAYSRQGQRQDVDPTQSLGAAKKGTKDKKK